MNATSRRVAAIVVVVVVAGVVSGPVVPLSAVGALLVVCLLLVMRVLGGEDRGRVPRRMFVVLASALVADCVVTLLLVKLRPTLVEEVPVVHQVAVFLTWVGDVLAFNIVGALCSSGTLLVSGAFTEPPTPLTRRKIVHAIVVPVLVFEVLFYGIAYPRLAFDVSAGIAALLLGVYAIPPIVMGAAVGVYASRRHIDGLLAVANESVPTQRDVAAHPRQHAQQAHPADGEER